MEEFCHPQLLRHSLGRSARASALCLLCLGFLLPRPSSAQMQTPVQNGDSAALQDLKDEVHELKDMVSQLQQQTVASRAEITRLREELEKDHGSNTSQSVTVDEQSPAYGTATTARLEQRLDSVQEQQELLSGKIKALHPPRQAQITPPTTRRT